MNFSINKDSAWNIALAFVLVAVVVMLPEASLAEGSEIVVNTVCAIVGELQGNIARAVAAFGIIFLGFSLFLGKISWGVALALGIGIGCIFAADQIVGLLNAGSDACT